MPKKPGIKELREAIAQKLDIKTARIYKRASDLTVLAQGKTEDGLYLLAAKSGINLNKYLPQGKVEQIRQILFQINQHPQPSQSMKTSPKKSLPKQIHLSIGAAFRLRDPLLTESVIKEGKEMAEVVYPLLYVFENSVREMILRVMQKIYGPNWWELKVSTDIKGKIQTRKEKEDKNPWHGKRGAHSIYYTDLEQLVHIVRNNWADFKDILPNQQWLVQRLEEISHSRNPVAHMNPLSKHDIQRIRVYFQDWERQITAKRPLIP
jgi:hypothetical protein